MLWKKAKLQVVGGFDKCSALICVFLVVGSSIAKLQVVRVSLDLKDETKILPAI